MRRISVSKRFSTAFLMGLLALLIAAMPTLAGVTWCRADPIVRLNGTDVQIWVAVPAAYAPLVNGPIDVTVKTPSAVTREVVFLDAGFNGYGETVSFADIRDGTKGGAFDMKVAVRVPMDVSGLPPGTIVPVQVEVIPANGTATYFNGTIDLTSFTMKIQGVN